MKDVEISSDGLDIMDAQGQIVKKTEFFKLPQKRSSQPDISMEDETATKRQKV